MAGPAPCGFDDVDAPRRKRTLLGDLVSACFCPISGRGRRRGSFWLSHQADAATGTAVKRFHERYADPSCRAATCLCRPAWPHLLLSTSAQRGSGVPEAVNVYLLKFREAKPRCK